ncbi:hypothetical protein BY996DRAFT_4593034 [Phakopsora pachyrhizi]|uniref:DUF7872 domain-containing protein n=1 Tax=Phakopsora pachyrhizi TaxID=170000 RepID=A0AAV0BVI1_PHAPC|nr:hypothetical protein BY996DRAFT_4593034 [Phakopsora pachyrhizi]CAH7690219.1 hypothetical protein PPACK8108_LOCUS25498 [Phakopsora pachyrhizi]
MHWLPIFIFSIYWGVQPATASLFSTSSPPKNSTADGSASQTSPTVPQANVTAPSTIVPGSNHTNPCELMSLSPSTWTQLKLNEYIANYPGGKNLTLEQYADSLSIQNFRCGIEEGCNVGEICNPAAAPDWYVLFSVQEWNNCMNSVYKAVHYATSVVQDTLALMISALVDKNKSASEWTFDIAVLGALVASFAAVVGLGASALIALGYLGILYGTLVNFGILSLLAGNIAAASFSLSTLLGQAPPDKKSFIKWGSIGRIFSTWESDMHMMIVNTTQTVINAPISSPEGISGIVKDGTFMYSVQPKSTADLQIEYASVIQARALVMVLRSMGAYVTRGSDKCEGSGPNGARGDKDELSFCTPDKIMMNIVLAQGGKTKNKIRNAEQISAKFGFTTEYIVMQSWNCQKKYNQFEYDPYRSKPLPSDPNDDCVINLPVCDLTDMRIERVRHKRGHSTTKACRVQGGLPI